MESDDRPYEFIIYGATGFTGKYCMEYMKLCLEKEEAVYRWAIAGRNEKKLIEARNCVADILGTSLDHIPLVIADNEDEQSLIRMCKQCNVLINCVGPFSKFGEPVLEACIKAKTHQVDVSGEAQYSDGIRLKYHKEAEKAGILIVTFCGFGFLIWEVAINHMKDVHKPMVFNSIECMMNGFLSSGFHETTFESLLSGMSNLSETIKNRMAVNNQVFAKSMPKFDYPLRSKYLPFYSEKVKGWCINSNAIHASVSDAQRYNYMYRDERPTQINGFLVVPSFLFLIMFFLINIVAFFFTRCKSGTRFLQRHVKLFTLGFIEPDGPHREELLRTPFELSLFGKGWKNENEVNRCPPNVERQLVVKGPNKYLSSPIFIIASAIAIHDEFNTDAIPYRGGVFTPGVALRDTRIVDTLKKNSVTFTLRD